MVTCVLLTGTHVLSSSVWLEMYLHMAINGSETTQFKICLDKTPQCNLAEVVVLQAALGGIITHNTRILDNGFTI